ncbi:WD repeat-containing protein AAC3-like [Athalia rosae]|uniref:WD repeat-containing protein AAC3-like n=1 Tax=Athalia rosae TaxID=37344 RepID=UPI00203440F8|nr:WD repeat-containing protein AAC3-like [Athalia rosae]
MQYQNFGPYSLNPIKAEPAERGPSPYQVATGSGIPPGGFSPHYRVEQGSPSPQPSVSLQPYGGICGQPSPGRTPSPIQYTAPLGVTQYNILPTHLQHQQQQQQQQQQQLQQQYSIPPQFQHTQQHQFAMQPQMMLNRVNQEQAESAFLPLDNPGIQMPMEGSAGVSSMLNLDNQQCNFELGSLNQLDSADLAMFDDNLSQNLSSNLSLSDIRISQVEASRTTITEPVNMGGGNGNNMTDSFTRLTTNTIQDICSLNNMYNPTRDNTG